MNPHLDTLRGVTPDMAVTSDLAELLEKLGVNARPTKSGPS